MQVVIFAIVIPHTYTIFCFKFFEVLFCISDIFSECYLLHYEFFLYCVGKFFKNLFLDISKRRIVNEISFY